MDRQQILLIVVIVGIALAIIGFLAARILAKRVKSVEAIGRHNDGDNAPALFEWAVKTRSRANIALVVATFGACAAVVAAVWRIRFPIQ